MASPISIIDAIWGGGWGRSRLGVLEGDGDQRRGGAIVGINVGHPIVNNGALLHSCAKVR